MEKKMATRRELLDRWRDIQEEDEASGLDPSKQRHLLKAKEEWFSDAFNLLISLSKENHIWCGSWDLMGPLLETFYNYPKDKSNDSPLKLLWWRLSEEMQQCIQCICQHHQAQELYNAEYESSTISPLLSVLRSLDEDRVTQHLKEVNAKVASGEYDPEQHNAEVVSIMYEVLMFPGLLDDESLVTEFQTLIEAIDDSHELSLAGHQQYPGVYALLFLKSRRTRAIGYRLAGYMGKLRRAADLEPLQPLLKKCIGLLETEVLPSTLETSRPRVQLERITVWLGIKALLGFLEPPAFEEGILEQYPIFLSIVLNHVSDDSLEFSYAVNCLRLLFEMLGCKLWLRTTLSPSVMRNTLLGQCFHTRNEKSHKEIFDLFQPFLQSLEALQDGEHEKQRRHFLYFLLHQVTASSNFSILMRKKACQIALLIVHRGYKMNPPCPPSECALMWGPSLLCSLKDSSLHNSLRQPAFDLIQTIIVSDAAALITLLFECHTLLDVDTSMSADVNDDEDELLFCHDIEEKENSCWSEFNVQSKVTSRDCRDWMCIPLLWFDVLVEVDPSVLPISFSKAVIWASSRFSMVEPEDSNLALSVRDWLSSCAGTISASFDWEVPTGSDHGGDGKESNNSVKASTMCITLIKAFKRFSAHFVIQMEQGGLWKQWTCEPRMAESLILLLLDPNDIVRQVDRLILEQVSNTRGLASGLQFLCSSASSLSAIYLGLRHAFKLVQLDFVLAKFHNLHHFFFVIRKLLKDAVVAPQTSIDNPINSSNLSKFSSLGGFLRQPDFGALSANIHHHALNSLDRKCWEKFCFLASEILWPAIRKCLVEGKAFIDNKSSQMTCVRLLEILPVIFERLESSILKLSRSSSTMEQKNLDLNWIHDLMDWGKSSLVVIDRYWRQTLSSLVNLLKGSCDGNSERTIKAIEKLISSGSIPIDELKGQFSQLSVSLLRNADCAVGSKTLAERTSPKSLNSEGMSFASDTKPNLLQGIDLQVVDSLAVANNRGRDDIIVLSDDEGEKVSPDAIILSHGKSSHFMLGGKTVVPIAEDGSLQDDGGCSSISSVSISKNLHGAFKFKDAAENPGVASQKHNRDASMGKHTPAAPYQLQAEVDKRKENISSYINNAFPFLDKADSIHKNSLDSIEEKGLRSKLSSTSLHQSQGVDGKRKGNISAFNLDKAFQSHQKSETIPKSLSDKSLDQVCLIGNAGTHMDSETRDTVITGLVRDPQYDPFELALKSAGHPLSLLTKPSTSVPRRKVMQLQMPVESKSSYLQRQDARSKRLKRPRLDDWYRPILEIDYFSTVGLSSKNSDENPAATKLKEVPVCFSSPEHYVEIFRPLVLEEFKAQLNSFFSEASSSEMCCGSLSVLSVERVDDFHLIRCVPDERDFTTSRGLTENDLVLLTKQPLQNSAHDIHMVGKVERRERDNKRRSSILVIRFYLQNDSARFNKAKRILIERSKWYVSRIMSITPQLREFQALSSLSDIPILPIILKPTSHSLGYHDLKRVGLGKLTQPLQRILKSSFNDGQLHAISDVIGTHGLKKEFELSLIQGPPGTGKTRTILAIVSVLLALSPQQKNDNSKLQNSCLSPSSISCSNPRISRSAAIARAWQDAALARQLNEEAEKNSKSVVSGGGRVLICAQSNAAVDELVARISNHGLYGSDGKMYKPYLVRVGNAKTVHPNSLPFFVDTLVDQRLAEERMSGSNAKNDVIGDSSMLLRSNLEKIVDQIRFYEAKRAELSDGSLDPKRSSEGVATTEDNGQELSYATIGTKLKRLYEQKKEIYIDLAAAQSREKKATEEIKALKDKLRKSILKEAEIVVTTLSGCGGDLYGVCSESLLSHKFGSSSEHTLFDAVVIDEAAQALEPATLIPLQLLKSNGTKCIMVGDPKQLPATVLSNIASKYLYECSMFERLQRAGHPVVMLTEQYRMHPEISQFPSLHFYENKLLNGDQMGSKSAPFHENAYLGPYVFFDITDGQEHHGKNSGSLSLYNECEADACVEVLRFLKKRYPSEFVGGRIGIISPYKSQVSLLRSRFSSVFGPSITADMEFNTVDGFQGREVDILLLSTVRASDLSSNFKDPGIASSTIGFVADVRRMNVALTRAKLSLWILGNARTLQTNQNWAALVKNAKSRYLVMSVARPYEHLFRKPFSASSKKPVSFSSDSHLKDPKQSEKIKESSNSIGQSISSSNETRKRETKNVSTDSGRQISRAGDDGNHNFSKKRECSSDIIPKIGNRSLKGTKSNTEKRVDVQGKSNKNGQKQINLDSDLHTMKVKATCENPGSENSQSHKQEESDSNNRTLNLEGLKGVVESSKHDSADAPKDLKETRKQQRDAVDALLSSALISSKKPEKSSKSAPLKRPLSPTITARGTIRPPKLRKGSSTSSASLSQIREASSVHSEVSAPQNKKDKSSRTRNLDEEWKCFKDLLGKGGQPPSQ
ncbi:uncharacterized protein LOC122082032 isoform X2 [Macadamia integrifolia]|uniref:uncharacterized protein LOC122082032 isoform X2 n=1 Tax=Macadamia integrifolia TaxID=60698 RepID=UPI001C4EEF9A|nr:uncharacterized protein LOC122082032 isoform X2 [Macadamia integrifolia]